VQVAHPARKAVFQRLATVEDREKLPSIRGDSWEEKNVHPRLSTYVFVFFVAIPTRPRPSAHAAFSQVDKARDKVHDKAAFRH
jgi:hypothetical protein